MANVTSLNVLRLRSGAELHRTSSVMAIPLAVALSAILAAMVYDALSGHFGILSGQLEIVDEQSSRVIKVPPGGSLQNALDIAGGGDIIELKAGSVYLGGIRLPNKPTSEFITIQTSALSDLLPGKRVRPEDRSSMAVIAAPGRKAAVSAANGAHHYRFVGIEFTTVDSSYNYGLIVFGGLEKRPELVPHHLEIDRSYLHPNGTGVVRRGIALNSANTTIKDSYISGFGFAGEETQGICGWSGTRNVHITNNYVEGGAENIMFGGADPANADLIPSHIEVRGNSITKPPKWAKTVTVKALFQLKNARGVRFIGNVLTGNWEGSAFRITVRNQDGGAPFSTIEDVEIRNNIIDGSGEGTNILGRDDTYPSQILKRLTISNNLFLNIGGDKFEGAGYFLQIADGEDITVSNNTVFNTGNIVTFYGTPPRGFTFIDNIVGHGSYGVHGLPDIRSSVASKIFRNNVVVNNLSVGRDDTSIPSGNLWAESFDKVGFLDLANRNFGLSVSSRFKASGSNGNDPGVDVRTLPPVR